MDVKFLSQDLVENCLLPNGADVSLLFLLCGCPDIYYQSFCTSSQAKGRLNQGS